MSFGLKVKGPPSKTTGVRISSPCANPPMVCLAMAWKEERAISAFATPWFNRGWISVFA